MAKRRQNPKQIAAQRRRRKLRGAKSSFAGYNGVKYTAEGKEEEFSDNEERGEQVYSIKQYIHLIKQSSKTSKAKEYLTAFNKKNWKFNKNNQNFLLRFILYEEIFGKEYLVIFKTYLKNMFPDTKAKFMKQLEEVVTSTKEDLANSAKMAMKMNGKELKYADAEHKEEFLSKLNKRCVELIEEAD